MAVDPDGEMEWGSLCDAPRDHAAFVDVPERQFLSIQGQGAAYDPAFQGAIRALHAVAASLKPRVARGGAGGVWPPRVETLWWWGHGATFPREHGREWRWRLLLPVPMSVDASTFGRARAKARGKRPELAVGLVELWRFAEGPSMQILHVGPYRDEGATARRLQEDVAAAGFEPTGLHHEIYLDDPRRAKPEALRTLLRQPVKRTRSGQRVSSQAA